MTPTTVNIETAQCEKPLHVGCISCERELRANTESKLTVQLTNEHRAITRDLERVKTHAAKFEANEAISLTELTKSVNEHFDKEERFLYPLLERFLGSNICETLKSEHDEIATVLMNLDRQTSLVEEHLIHLEQLLRAHVSVEENVLFWYLNLEQPTE
ncbi:MAG TPA: hemerythrin domain-containing protein [Candidatus Acidoferrales bacterium]|nr:hemerythrin domain-containing protein [Candidatus Acidoferrales bacterium]